MLKETRPIGIFDSGVGGLSVLSELDKVMGAEHYIYFADNLHMPYGNKEKCWLKKRIKAIIR